MSVGSDTSESVSISSLSEARSGSAAVVYDKTKIIVLGGWNGECLPTVEMFDTVNNASTKLPPMPAAWHGLAAGVAGSSILAVGGCANGHSSTSTVELLDMITLK